MLSRGLILVTGAAGSGKSTTLAAMLDYRNTHAGGHILCIEDPIEFLHKHKQSVVNQREVGLDTRSFSAALHNALREAPDVIMIGEIRDLDTMQHALHYAETGHLCIATLPRHQYHPCSGTYCALFPRRSTQTNIGGRCTKPRSDYWSAFDSGYCAETRGRHRVDAGHTLH